MQRALKHTQDYMTQYKIDNPGLGYDHYRKLYVKIYNDYKRSNEPYTNERFGKSTITKELILDIRKFVHIFDLKKDNLTIIDLFRIVEKWSEIEPKHVLYDNYEPSKQIKLMYRDIVKFNNKYNNKYYTKKYSIQDDNKK